MIQGEEEEENKPGGEGGGGGARSSPHRSGLHWRISKQNYFIKIFFCELNIVGMVCWTTSCQKKIKQNHGNPSETGQNMLISFRRPN